MFLSRAVCAQSGGVCYSLAEAADAAVLSALPDGTLRLLSWLLGLLGSRRQPRALRAMDIGGVNQDLMGCEGAHSASPPIPGVWWCNAALRVAMVPDPSRAPVVWWLRHLPCIKVFLQRFASASGRALNAICLSDLPACFALFSSPLPRPAVILSPHPAAAGNGKRGISFVWAGSWVQQHRSGWSRKLLIHGARRLAHGGCARIAGPLRHPRTAASH